MLKRIEIENFQGHVKSAVDLSPGVNVIIGESDKGKSSIFRAIEWVRSNRPLGDGFRSEWGGDTTARIITDDAQTIERIKTSKLNGYNINGKVFKAFGQNPPDEVNEALRIDSVNVQTQDEPPFLLQESPGEAAKVLNKAANIQDIHTTISSISKSAGKLDRKIETLEDVIEVKEKELAEFPDIGKASELLGYVETLEQVIRKLNTDSNYLRTMIRSIESVEEKLDKLDHIPDVSSNLNELESSIMDLGRDRVRVGELKAIVDEIRGCDNDLERGKRRLESLKKEYEELKPETCPLCGGEMG